MAFARTVAMALAMMAAMGAIAFLIMISAMVAMALVRMVSNKIA